MKVYVTGASGFLGRRVALALVRAGHQVVALSRDPAKIPPHEGIEARKVDLLQLEQVLPAIEDCEGGVHCAGAGPGESDAALHDANVQVSRHVAGSARRYQRLARLVAFTSAAVAEPGDTPYRRVKIGQEAALRTYGLDLTVLRPTQILGPWQESRELQRLVGRLRSDKPFPLVGGGRIRVQPVAVDDAARAAVTALARPQTIGRIYPIAGPEAGIRWCDLVAEVKRRTGGKAPLRSLPRLPLRFAGFAASLIGSGYGLRAALTYYRQDHLYDLAASRADLDFDPLGYPAMLDAAFGAASSPAEGLEIEGAAGR
jgi:nucleoside-diphosphate-sugar epimerase